MPKLGGRSRCSKCKRKLDPDERGALVRKCARCLWERGEHALKVPFWLVPAGLAIVVTYVFSKVWRLL